MCPLFVELCLATTLFLIATEAEIALVRMTIPCVSAKVTGLHQRGVSVQSENPLDTEGLKGTS